MYLWTFHISIVNKSNQSINQLTNSSEFKWATSKFCYLKVYFTFEISFKMSLCYKITLHSLRCTSVINQLHDNIYNPLQIN